MDGMPRAGRYRHIAAVLFDQHNLAEMARHHISKAEADQLILNRYIVVQNPRGRSDSIMLIGETNGGRLVTMPLTPLDDHGLWRPATAFDASRHQRRLFQRDAR